MKELCHPNPILSALRDEIVAFYINIFMLTILFVPFLFHLVFRQSIDSLFIFIHLGLLMEALTITSVRYLRQEDKKESEDVLLRPA